MNLANNEQQIYRAPSVTGKMLPAWKIVVAACQVPSCRPFLKARGIPDYSTTKLCLSCLPATLHKDFLTPRPASMSQNTAPSTKQASCATALTVFQHGATIISSPHQERDPYAGIERFQESPNIHFILQRTKKNCEREPVRARAGRMRMSGFAYRGAQAFRIADGENQLRGSREDEE